MILTKQHAIDTGGFVSTAPVKKEITWHTASGEQTAIVFVRLKSYQSVMAELKSGVNGDAAAARIASSIVDEKNQPIFTIADIVGNDEHGPMGESLTIALLNAISEANSFEVKPGPKP